VGGLHIKTKDNELNEHFAKYGKINLATVIKHKDSGLSRGFGFVFIQFKDEGEAERMSKEILDFNKSRDGHRITDKRVDVKLSNDDR
jgi:RNA recognition motif-containing protein